MTPSLWRHALAVLTSALLFPALASAGTYEVGPGQPLANVGDVPWESLGAGDTVLIHWRATSYKEKFVLCRQGTQSQPIVVRGVLGPNGERPIIAGDGATTRAALDFWGEERGVIKIGGANKPADTMPRWIVLENLDVTSGRPPFSFNGRNGTTAYAQNAAAVYIEKGENVTVRNCVIRDSGNGLFAGSQAKDLLVEGNDIRDNGNAASIYEHNNYTAAVGITFQFNRFRPLRAGCSGNNLKDRSVGTVIRYNWIEGGNRNLDLVDAEDDPSLISDPRYRQTFVYGNVLIKPDGGNSQIAHYGGDSGNTDIYRKGTLYFFNNTVVSTRSGNTTLVALSTNEEHADIRNNILHVTAAGSALAMVDAAGMVELYSNWTKQGWVDSHGALDGTITDHGGAVTGTSPGFTDEVGGDYHLASGSGSLDKGTSLAAAALSAHALGLQYLPHQASEARPVDGPLDLGAFERCASPACARPDAGDPASTPDGAALPGVDAAAPGSDAAASPKPDASAPGSDAGSPEPDAAVARPDDAAVALADAAATPGADPSTDAGQDAALAPAGLFSTCGCSAGAVPMGVLFWALGAGLLVARRRRPQPRS